MLTLIVIATFNFCTYKNDYKRGKVTVATGCQCLFCNIDYLPFLTGNKKSEEEINKEAIKMVRELVGPVAAFKLVASVKGLPKTRSGKTARKTIADLARSKQVKVIVVELSLIQQ